MTQKELFRDFINLGYKPQVYRGLVPEDIMIADYTFLRMTPKEYIVYYLYSGTRIIIPWEWIDIFSGFNIHSGGRSHHIGHSGDSADKLIYLFLCLIQSIESCSWQKFLQILGDIFENGGNDFRKIMPNLRKITLLQVGKKDIEI